MSIYISKDISEKLDYAIVASLGDPILTVIPEQSPDATVQVVSCTINATPVTDDVGNEYPAKSCIIFWLDGGSVGQPEWLNLTWITQAGRRFDEKFILRLEADC